MPLVNVDIVGPRTADYVEGLLTAAREAVIEALSVDDDTIIVRVNEAPRSHVGLPPCRTDSFTQVQVVMYDGRSDELKASLIDALRTRFGQAAGLRPSDVAVHLCEAPRTELDVLPGID